MIRTLTSAIAFLALFPSTLPANPGFDPAKVIIIKADDYSGNFNSQQQKWTDFVNASRNLGIKVSLGVIPARIPANNDAATWMQQQQALGDVGFWNHGWDHSRDPADPPTFWEFRNTGLAFQQTHFADAQAALLTATGRDSITFGAPYNQTDADTMTVMNNTPPIRLFFTYNGGTARTQGLVARVHTIGIIAESGGTGKPVASTFINTYPNGPAGPVSLQLHPAAFATADLAEYVQIVEFLQGKGYSFLLPEQYIAALDGSAPEGAKIWTGASDANWTTGGNWSPTGAPASSDDVAFTGTGTNLDTQFNGTARSLNSLTFTAGQSSPVTVTTTNTAQLSLGPASGAGPFTILDVATGSHQFIGTNGATNTAADFRFLGTTGTTFVLNVAGSAGFDINGRIVNSGGTASNRTFQKTGTGRLIFSGDSGGQGAWQHNTGSGFQIQQGVLRFAALNAGGNSGNNYLVSSGAALELDGNFNQTINNGTYSLNGTGVGGTGAIRSLSGTKSILGTGTGGVNLATNAGIGVDAGNLTIAQVVKGPGSLTKVGAGTLTLTGANTYSGATHLSAGTLALGASNVLPATPVSLGDATLTVGAGFTETTGRLDVTGAATLHLGSDTSAIAFADNGDLLDWGGTLNITGSFVPNVSLRFGTDAAGLTTAQLAKITVNGVGGLTLNAGGYLGEPVEVVPKHYDVYLIAGQSNADGRGTNSELTGPLAPYAGQQAGVKIFYVNPINKDPVNPTWNSGWRTLEPGYSVIGTVTSLPSTRFGFEVSLGKALAAKDTERNIAFIKVSQGGTSLANDWDPAGGANFMWQTFANKVPEALAALTANGDTAEIHGMFWHQGESDGSNPTFQADLVEFIAACRTLTVKPNLPFAIGELEREPGGSTRATQLTAMANVASADPNAFVVSSAGLATYDGTHFTSAAYITFGERFAKAYFDFLDGLNFTVTYNSNESTGGSVPVDSRIYNSVATATVLGAGSLTKSGHNFTGWNTAATGTGTAYSAGNVFVTTENTTLHAQWTPKPTPTITTLPSAAPITEGQPLSASSLDGGSASVPGTFAFTNPAIIPPAGTYAADLTFTPTDTATYSTVQTTVNVTVRTRFEAWADDETITFAGDTNGDGIADGMAWLLGAASPAANANALLPSPAETNGALAVRFTMRNQAARGAAALTMQYGTTLGSWTTIPVPEVTPVNPVNGVTFAITPDDDLNQVVATIPSTAAPEGRIFARLSGNAN